MRSLLSKNDAGNEESMVPFVIPSPILDQIGISVWVGNDGSIRHLLSEHLGKSVLTKDRRCIWWPEHGLRLDTFPKHEYQVLRLQADEPILEKLSPILRALDKKPDGKPAAQLMSAEIAWDFPVSMIYDEAEDILRKVASVAIPIKKRATLRVLASEEFYCPTLGGLKPPALAGSFSISCLNFCP